MEKTIALKKNYEFKRVFKRGRFFVGKHITIYVLENKSGFNKLGVAVGKVVGKSVKRNRFKRLIRESYRLHEPFLKTGFDIVFVAKKCETIPSFSEISAEMKHLLNRLGLLEGGNTN